MKHFFLLQKHIHFFFLARRQHFFPGFENYHPNMRGKSDLSDELFNKEPSRVQTIVEQPQGGKKKKRFSIQHLDKLKHIH